MSNDAWRVFRGNSEAHDGINRLLEMEAPSWRKFSSRAQSLVTVEDDQAYWRKLWEIAVNKQRDIDRGKTFRVRLPEPSSDGVPQPQTKLTDHNEVLDAVNAALYLRRPLLVTGRPGSGKTSLAYAVAYELKLGPVLKWAITARSTLQEGLYQYDAIARLQDAQLSQTTGKSDLRWAITARSTPQEEGYRYEAIARLQDAQLSQNSANSESRPTPSDFRDIGQYIRLGPVGTAFWPSTRPRVLLIDEIDKSDINLPNELLNLFEEGEFDIPELVRLSKQGEQRQIVQSEDGLSVSIVEGRVPCGAFPFIIMTSNGERDFPPAFYRRCLRVAMPAPTPDDLKEIVKSHLGQANIEAFQTIIDEFVRETNRQEAGLATDQLLNMVYLFKREADGAALRKLLFTPLTDVDVNQ